MVLKNVCLVPHAWTLVDGFTPMDIYRMHSCSDGSHAHISQAQLKRYEARTVRGRHKPLAAILRRADNSNSKIVAIRIPEYDAAGASAQRGRSCQLGEYLTLALVAKLLWARVMLSDIRHRGVGDIAEDLA